MDAKTCWDTIELTGGQLLDKVRELLAEGNVRHVRIRQKDRTVAEFPLTFGVAGVVLAPVLAAIGALAALLADCSIDIERTVNAAPKWTRSRSLQDYKCWKPTHNVPRHSIPCVLVRGVARRRRFPDCVIRRSSGH